MLTAHSTRFVSQKSSYPLWQLNLTWSVFVIGAASVVASVILIVPFSVQADCNSWFSEETKGWEKQKEDSEVGITIFSQKGSTYDRFKGTMEIKTSPEVLENLLFDPEGKIGGCQRLFPKCKKALVISRNCQRVDETPQDKGESYQLMAFEGWGPVKGR